MWLVTRQINDYHQDGDYLVAVFYDKPNFAQLKKLIPGESDVTLGKLLGGGGRQEYEAEWFHLAEIADGELYVS